MLITALGGEKEEFQVLFKQYKGHYLVAYSF